MAFRKNKKFIDPRYFMDEKIELTENQKRNITTLLEQEIAKGSPLTEGMLQDLAKKFGVPIALVAAIASGIGAVNTSVDVSSASNLDTTEMPADADADASETNSQLERVRGKMKDLKTQIDQSGDPTGELQSKLDKLDRTETAIMQAGFNKMKF